MSTRNLAIAIAAILAVGIAIIAIVSSNGEDSADAKDTDGAFVVGMIPHHQSAIEMAEIAAKQGEHPEVKELAGQIATTQAAEIRELERIHQRLFGQPSSQADHGTLGMADHEMGMNMDASELAGSQPFDKAFIDMMVPHHQGAIRMARVQLASGEDPDLTEIAEAIVAAQAAEIEEMNRWRTEWYGEPSPAGGVPAEAESSMPSHEEMGH